MNITIKCPTIFRDVLASADVLNENHYHAILFEFDLLLEADDAGEGSDSGYISDL